MLENYLESMLSRRQQAHSLRRTVWLPHLVDFCSNDYLGLSRSEILAQRIKVIQNEYPSALGATGSRLLTGHYPLIDEVETQLATFHQAPAALLFNSGYDANLSLLSCLPRRRDLLLYDELIHASLHDGIKLSAASALAFRHNDSQHLAALLHTKHQEYEHIFIIIESIYSMDGDVCPLPQIAELAKQYGAYIIIDEAHSTGIWGEKGEGLAASLGLSDVCFARLHTFGKAMGGHGAVVVGSTLLRSFLLNFARPLIYTTALPPHSLLHIREAYRLLHEKATEWLPELQQKIAFFRELMHGLPTPLYCLPSPSPIQSIIVGGNEPTRALAQQVQQQGFDVRPILSPTVPAGTERIRICLHLFNTKEEMELLANSLGR